VGMTKWRRGGERWGREAERRLGTSPNPKLKLRPKANAPLVKGERKAMVDRWPGGGWSGGGGKVKGGMNIPIQKKKTKKIEKNTDEEKLL